MTGATVQASAEVLITVAWVTEDDLLALPPFSVNVWPSAPVMVLDGVIPLAALPLALSQPSSVSATQMTLYVAEGSVEPLSALAASEGFGVAPSARLALPARRPVSSLRIVFCSRRMETVAFRSSKPSPADSASKVR